MTSDPDKQPSKVEKISTAGAARPVSDELARLTAHLKEEFPQSERVSFEFTDKLRLHIDVRTLEDAHTIHARLPALCGGIFSGYFVGSSPNHRFFHRVSALAGA